MKRRLLALCLVLAMLFPMCPLSAKAEENVYLYDTGITDVHGYAVEGESTVYVTYSLDSTVPGATLVAAAYAANGKMVDSGSLYVESTGGRRETASLEDVVYVEGGRLEAFLLDGENNVLGHFVRNMDAAKDTEESGVYGEAQWVYKDGTLNIYADEPCYYENQYMGYGWSGLKDKVRTIQLRNIRNISGSAFQGFSVLETVEDDTGTLEEIGSEAFQGCAALSYIRAENLKKVSREAFRNCVKLDSIPDTLETVGLGAFMGCSSLSSADLGHIEHLGESAFADSGIYSAAISMATLEKIPSTAFSGCKNLTNVEFLDVSEKGFSIGFQAFAESGLTTIDLTGCTAIAREAFADAADLRLAQNTNGLTEIGENAFRNTHLYGIWLPGTVTEIPEGAFADCRFMNSEYLGYVYMPGAKSIASGAFENSTIGTLYLSNALEEIEENAFLGAKIGQLKVPAGFDWSIVIDEGNEALLALRPVEETAAAQTPEETIPETTEETVPETTEEKIPETTEETVPETTEEAVPETPEEALTPEEAAEEGMYLAPEGAEMVEDAVLEEMAFFQGTDQAKGSAHTAAFTGLAPKEAYLLVVSRNPGSVEKEDLQYIGLASSDETGSLTVKYIPKSDISAIVGLFGPKKLQFQEERITLKQGQTVSLHPNVPSEEYGFVHFEIPMWRNGEEWVPVFDMNSDTMELKVNDFGLEDGAVATFSLKAWIGERANGNCAAIEVTVLSEDEGVKKVLLDQNTATVNPNSTVPVEIPISLSFGREQAEETFALDGTEDGQTQVRVTEAAFAQEALNGLFALSPKDDHTLLLTVKDGAAVKKNSYSSKLLVTVGDKTLETGPLKLTVKKSLPKITAKALSFNSFYNAASQPVTFTGAQVESIDLEPYAKQNQKVLGAFEVSTEGGLVLTPKTDKTFSGTLTVNVTPVGYTQPVKVAVSVKISSKAPSLKLDKTAVTLNIGTDDAELRVLSGTKGVSIAELGLSEDVEIEGNDGFANLDPLTGRLSFGFGDSLETGTSVGKLVFHFKNSDRVWKQTVKITRIMPKLKLNKTSLTINKNYRDTGVVTTQYVTNGYWPSYDAVVWDNRGNSVGRDELQVSIERGGYYGNLSELHVTSGKNADPKKTYTVALYAERNWLADRCLLGKITVKVVDKTVTAAPKVTGKLDSFQPQSTVVVKPNFKNLTGQQAAQVDTVWNLFDAEGEWCGYMVNGTVQPDGSLKLSTDISNSEVLPAGKYILKLTYTLRDGTVLEAEVPVTATQTSAKLKLGKASVVLNPYLGNVAVSAVPAVKGYGRTQMGMIAQDAAGNQVNTYDLPFFVNLNNEDGKVVLSPKSWAMPEEDTTYRLTLFPDNRSMEQNGVVLTVKVLGEASRESQKASLSVAGTLDPAVWSSSVTITPKITGADNDVCYQDCEVTLESSTNGKSYTEVETFSVEKLGTFAEDGKIALSQKAIALNPALKYRVTVSYQNGSGDTFATGTAQLKLKQTAPKLKVTGTALIRNDAPYYGNFVRLTNTVKGQNPIARVQVGKKMAEKFSAYYDMDTQQLRVFVQGYANKAKSATLPIEVFLEGNETDKPNGTVTVKVTLK